MPSRHDATLHYSTEVGIRATCTTAPFPYLQSSRDMPTYYLESAYIKGNVPILYLARGVHPLTLCIAASGQTPPKLVTALLRESFTQHHRDGDAQRSCTDTTITHTQSKRYTLLVVIIIIIKHISSCYTRQYSCCASKYKSVIRHQHFRDPH